ncbi:hypothetical protein L2091_15445 [Curtobacterium albidum]|uniref:hypothetical protein n=1 Tax=Curtobacterium citreum TaxID=2036 RepID=UPI002025CEE3|nr:hypothetical protein [Curtobacterium albidum]MCL9666620.1 hypothetical protein [Curtobacterium albidum]
MAALLRSIWFRSAIALALVATVVGGLVAVQSNSAGAATFQAGNIISDANFYNANAMSEAEIQAFLNANEPSCGNGNCLRLKRTNTTSRGADAMCAAYQGAANELTSTIIYKVQRSCSISAKALLVILQKEQSLVTMSAPSDARLDRAMGYACPDNTAKPGWCDPAYAGLYNQIYLAAWQLKRYGNPPGTSNYFTWYPIGVPSDVRFNPTPSCGSSKVTVQNKATAALYYYTPYQPNANVLAGRADRDCGAYGNLNFFNYYQNWFGSPTGASQPFGNVEGITTGVGSVSVSGWAIDPDAAKTPIQVHVYIDGVGAGALTANQRRADVGAAYPSNGPDHGFGGTFGIAGGQHQVCLFFIDAQGGPNTSAGCQTVQVPTGNPFGALDSVTTSGNTVTLRGWAIDPDTTASIPVDVYANAQGQHATADQSRPDVAKVYPAYGAAHGFQTTMTLSPGTWNVCAYGINQGGGTANTGLGCRSVTIVAASGNSPTGVFDSATPTAGGITVRGWAFDADTAGPLTVKLSVGSTSSTLPTNQARADVQKVYPKAGATSGFGGTVTAPAGVQTICATAVNVGSGKDTDLGCKTVTVLQPVVDTGAVPRGNVDAVTAAPGGITVRGWAFDSDTPKTPLTVTATVGGTVTKLTADTVRTDVGNAYPAAGAAHGFEATVPARTGPTQICLSAVNTGTGGDTSLGCWTVTVTDAGSKPIGWYDAATAVPGGVRVVGWAFDPDTAKPIAVRASVAGVTTVLTASGARADVPKAYPAATGTTGFDATVPTGTGAQTVCLTAVNDGKGGDTDLGCRQVTVAGDPGTKPRGSVDSVTGVAGGIAIRGWAFDQDTPGTAITVKAQVGPTVTPLTANVTRSDVGAAYPALGPAHGFDTTVPAASGRQQVCFTAVNTGTGGDSSLGCFTVTVP